MRDYFSFTPEIRFFSNDSWYFVTHIKSTHQLCDPSKKDLKVKILDLSRLATLNFARLTMHL